MSVPRNISGFDRDADGVWVAALDCGHRRHVRHRPPLSSYPWIEDAAERDGRIGTAIECDRCARRELPTDAEVYKRTPDFDERSLPAGLRRAHRTRRGVWGRLHVDLGHVRLSFGEPLDVTIELEPGQTANIPPELPHEVSAEGPFRLHVEFLRSSSAP